MTQGGEACSSEELVINLDPNCSTELFYYRANSRYTHVLMSLITVSTTTTSTATTTIIVASSPPLTQRRAAAAIVCYGPGAQRHYPLRRLVSEFSKQLASQ